MRLIAFTLAVFVVVGPAAAQNWQEYSYPDYSFRVSFPADPQVESTTYQVTDDRAVEAKVYSVRQDNSVLKLTVADLAGTDLEEGAVIDHAIKMLSEGGEVKVDIPHRINRVYGRQLSILGADGGRSTVAVFAYGGRLYLSDRRKIAFHRERCNGGRHPLRAIAHIHRRRFEPLPRPNSSRAGGLSQCRRA